MAKSTVEKGNDFEDKVYKVIKNLLEKDDLPISSKRSLVFQKKGYYSKVRGANIIFDITIETYLPNESEYSSLWIIECKDYKQAIPVNRIQTFKTQIDEVAGHKGVFISTSKYQKGAIDTAKSYGIGLAIMQPNESLYWQVKRIDSGQKSYGNEELENIFYENEYKTNEPFIVSIKNKVFTNIVDYLSYEGIEALGQSKISVPYLTKEKIEETALNCFGKIGVQQYFTISSEEIINLLRSKYNIEIVCCSDLDDRELGRLDLNKNIIYISSTLEENSPRWRFTLAHELGHVVLHKTLLMNSGVYIAIEEENKDPFLYNTTALVDKNLRNIEIQANIFASYVLLPNFPIRIKVKIILNELNMLKPIIHFDDQPFNITECHKIFAYIGEAFGVSKEVVKYRLIELGLLEDHTRTKSLDSAFRSIYHEGNF